MLYATKTIHVGDHPHFALFGLTFDTDIALSTLLALAVIVFMGVRLRKNMTDGEWAKITGMGRQIAADNDLFATDTVQADNKDLATCA